MSYFYISKYWWWCAQTLAKPFKWQDTSVLVKSEELLSAVYDALFCCESTMIARVIQEVLYSQYGCSCISFMLCVHHMQSLNTLTGFLCVCVCVCVCDSQLQYPGCRFTYISVVTFCCICENKQMIKFYIMAWILSVRSNVSTYIYIHTHTHTHIHWCQRYIRSSHLLNSILLR